MMSHNIWRRWVSRLFTKRLRIRPRKRPRPLGIEFLEDRVVPATDSWTGGGGLANLTWSDTANWSLGRAPITGDNVVFNLAIASPEVINDNLTTNPILSSVTVSSANYTLGKSGSSPLYISGSLNIGSGINTITVNQSLDFLPPPTTPQVTIGVNSGSTLDLTGLVSAASNVTVSKTDPGILILAGASTAWAGNFTLADSGSTGGGVVEVTNSQALGSTTVTVNTNTQLQLFPASGNLTFTNSLLTNGSGVVGDGAVLNVAGNNTWSGPVQMDSDTTFGIDAGTQLTITGVISDNSTGHNLIKLGDGALVFPGANTYRGDTTVDDGILEIENPLSLGAGANALDSQSGSPQSETIVNDNPTDNLYGTLELNYSSQDVSSSDPNALLKNPNASAGANNPVIGFQVFNDILVINGPGFDGLGALDNAKGDNEWDGSVLLGGAPPEQANPTINIAGGTQLIISGVVSDPNQASSVAKIGGGELVLSDANTYRGAAFNVYSTYIEAGILDITDSNALGTGSVFVSSGSALQLDVDSGFDGTSQRTHNRNLGFDSVTGSGPGQELDITGDTGTFALNLGGRSTPSINVASLSPAQLETALQTDVDALLTSSGYPSQSVSSVTQDGSIYRIIFSNSTDVALMTTTTTGGLSVAVNPIYGLQVANALTIQGPGISTSPDSGALNSDSGINIWTGTITLDGTAAIGVEADNQTDSAAYNQVVTTRAGHPLPDNDYLQWDYSLTVTGTITNYAGVDNLVKTGLGNLILPNANTYGGPDGGVGDPDTTIQLGWITIENDYSLGYNEPPSNANEPQTLEPYIEIDKGGALQLDPTPGNALILYNNFLVTGNGITSPTYGLINQAGAIENLNGDNTLDGILQLDGTVGIGVEQIPSTSPNPPNSGFPAQSATSQPLTASQLTLTGYLWNYASTTGGLDKLGSRRLIIQGSGTYTGNVDIQDGVLLVQNDTALGAGNSTSANPPTVTVEPGAALELGNYVNGEDVGNGFINENGGIQSGVQVYGERLVLNGSGDPTFNDSALNVLASNDTVLGPTVQTVTVTGSSTGTYQLQYTYNGNTYATSPIAATATAAQLQSIIDGILPTGGTVEVIQTGNVYTLTFGGVLLNTTYASLLLSLTVLSPYVDTGTFAVVNTVTPVSSTTAVAPVNDPIVATDSIWRGPVTLANNTTVTVDTNSTLPSDESASRLIFEGDIGDDYPASAPASLTILGGGEVDLNGTNTYSGTTYIQQGVVSIDNPSALGGTGVPEVQTLTLANPVANSTKFMFTFNGFNDIPGVPSTTALTQSITYTGNAATDAARIASAIDAVLDSSGSETDGGGSVSVTETIAAGTAKITVTFGGSLVGFPINPLGAALVPLSPTSPPTTASISSLATETQAGAGGTIVENGASLEVAGSFSVSGEPLILEGNGTTQDIQSVTVPTQATGTFTLTFFGSDIPGGATTPDTTTLTLPDPNLQADLQTALQNLPNIGGVGGTVTLSLTSSFAGSNTYSVSFGGTLSGENLETLQAFSALSGGSVSTALVQAGSQTIAGVPTQWFQAGPAPEDKGQTGGNQPVSGEITSEAVDPLDPTVMYVGTAGGGVWKSIDDGNSWQPIFDAIPEIQVLTVSPGATGTFYLSLDGVTNSSLAPLNLSSPTLAGDIQTYLDSLSNIGGVGGQVTVSQSGDQFMITFNGTLAGAAVDLLAVNAVNLNGTITPQQFEQGMDPNFAIYVGAVTVDPENSNIIYVGTGVANSDSDTSVDANTTPNSTYFGNSNNAFYGTGVYESTDGGLTWSLLLDDDSSPTETNFVTGTTFINPFYGMAVTGIAVDPATGFEASPTIYVSSGVVGGTGVGDGVLNGDPINGIDTDDIVQGAIQPGGTGQLAGVWRFSPDNTASTDSLGTWFNLTDVTSGARQIISGQQSEPPETPGPDDDFRIYFPEENVSNVIWTEVQVVDTGIANDGGEFGNAGSAVPVLYASLGTPGQYGGEDFSKTDIWPAGSPVGAGVNAVYRCYGADSTSPIWYIGDPGKPQNQIESITINDPSGINGDFTLSFNGYDTDSGGLGSGGVFPGTIGPMTYDVNLAQDVASELQFNLDQLKSIGGVGVAVGNPGFVVVSVASATATQTVFDVEFEGGLALTPLPLIGVVNYTDQISSIVVAVTQPGGGVDSETADEFPTYYINGSENGYVKFTVAPLAANTNNWVDEYVLYASVPNSQTGNVLGIWESSNGGESWTELTGTPEYMNGQGNYANAIVATSDGTVYVGGAASDLEDPTNMMYVTTNGGTSWTNVSVDASVTGTVTTTGVITPHNAIHVIVPDPSQGTVIIGTDGGIWQLVTTTQSVAPFKTTYAWNDLNSDLATAMVNGVDAAQDNPGEMVVGAEGNGLAYFNGLLAWIESDENGAAGDGPSGGLVYIDPDNTNIVYAVLSNPPPDGISSNFLISNDGGKTWAPVASLPENPFTGEYPYFTFLIDPLNSNRLLLGGPDGLQQSLDGGQTWITLLGADITSLAVAGYQGVFVSDPSFPDVTDIGANVDDPNTIYASDGTNLYVTKDLGLNWVVRTPEEFVNGVEEGITGTIESITVNPANRDNVFVVTQGTPGQGFNQVWESTNAGQNWTLIGGAGSSISGLADDPIWQLVIDPRNGTLYVGTDIGVYELPDAAPLTATGATTPSSGAWTRFGIGMPNVSVRILKLDLSTNTMIAGTYGRGVYQLFLDATETSTTPVTAAIVGLSGNSFWAGPVNLIGDSASNTVTVAADGTQGIPDGITAASINFVGTVDDLIPASNPTVTKTGDGDVIFSGDNVYGGLTIVGEGNLIASNYTALGLSSGGLSDGTTVISGASLGLLANLDGETVTLNGNGISFDGHFEGALRNVSGANTFAGNVYLVSPPADAPFGNDSVTIGADSGSEMIMNGAIFGGDNEFTLVKEGTGAVAFDNTTTTATSYVATTAVYRGALEAETSGAFGGTSFTNPNTVEVLDGAQVQIATPSGSATTTIANPLLLSGTGINGTGALLDVGGMATWAGMIMFEMLPGFAPLALTAGTISSIAIGADAGATLTISGAIDEETATGLPGNSLPLGLLKVGAGTVALSNSNSYSGSTEVQAGILDVQNATALGTRTTAGGLETIDQIITLSDSGAISQTSPVGAGTGAFTLSFDGKAATQSKLDFGASASAVLGVLDGGAGGGGGLFASAGIVGGTVEVFQTPILTTNQYAPGKTTPPDDVNGWVYTIIFTGGSNDFTQTPLQVEATGTGGTFATTSIVAAGQVDALVDSNTNGTGELELDNSAITPSPLTVSQYTLTLNGDGPTGNGALYNLAGDNVWSGPIILASNSGIGVSAANSTTPSSLTIPYVIAESVENAGVVPPVPELTKVAPGTLIIPSSTTYSYANYYGETYYSYSNIQYSPEITVVADGSLQVDATTDSPTFTQADPNPSPNPTIAPPTEMIGPMQLAGGTLSGNGEVQSIQDEGASIGGAIDPGDNYPSENFGVLSSVGSDSANPPSDVTLSAHDTYYVDLGIPASGLQGNNPPSPANKTDVLDVTNGTINLGGATLSGLVNPLVAIGDAYTIINDPNGIIGEFANQGGNNITATEMYAKATVTYIGGVKFEVDYVYSANSSIVTRVDVIRELANDTLSLSPSNAAPVYGQDEQFIATVTPETGAPPVTGTVVFSVLGPTSNAPSQYDINLVNGVATLDLPTALDGPPIEGGNGYTVSASYSGVDANGNDTFEPSGNSTPTVTVTTATVTTKLVFSYNYPLPQVYGAPFAIDATVYTNVASPVLNTLAPAGYVDFYDGSTLLEANVPLSVPPAGTTSAVAVYNSSTPLLGTGNHTIYGLYVPDYTSPTLNDNYMNTSPPTEGIVGLTIHQDGTSMSVAASPTSAVTGQAGIQFTATVTPTPPGSGDPTGSVIFKQGSIVLGSGTLSTTGGVTTATFTTTSGQLLAGSTQITAYYNGDSNFTGSSGSTSGFVVNQAATSVLLSSSDLVSPYGQAVTFTAAVSPTGLGGGIPTGTVYFYDAATPNTPLGSGSVNGNGIASFTTTAFQLPAGSGFTLPTTQGIYAKYSGDANYTGATSNTIEQTITQAVAAVNVSTSGASVYGQPVTLTATVTPTNPGGNIPTGTVTFFLGSSIVSGVNLTVTGTDQVVPDGYSPQQSDVGDYVAISGAGWNQGVYQIVSAITNASWTLNASPAAVGATMGQWQEYGSFLGSHSLGTTLGVTSASYTTTINQLPVGTNQTITAVYSGDLHYSLNTGTGYQTVSQDNTTTSLTSSGPILPGQTATLTAQVSANSPGGGTPTGTVTFTLDGTLLGAGPVALTTVNGVTSATISIPSSDLAIGPNVITASYSGDSNFIASSASLTQQEEDKTTTTVATSLTPAVYGEPVTLTATIAPVDGGAAISPTGTVTFMSGSTTLGTAVVGTVTLNGNTLTTAELTVSNIPTGANQTIDAFYSGDSTFVGSEGAVTQTINKDTTKTTVSSTSTSVENGQVVILTAQVVAVTPGEGSPTGTVTFKRGSTAIGTGTISNGVATLQTTLTVVGKNSITAVYGGDANDLSSTSAVLSITVSAVGARASKVTLASSLNPSDVGQAVTFTATVVDAGGGAAHTPTGTVSFFYGTTLLGYGALSGSGSTAKATFTTSTLPLGSDSISAAYNGNASFAHSKSAVLTQTVNALAVRPSDITLSQSLASSTYGETVAFTATVNDLGSGASETPTGTVTFFATSQSNNTVYNMGSGTLVGGVGSATTTIDFSTLPVDTYTISASYSGDGAFVPETNVPTPLTHYVAIGASGITLTSSLPSGSVYGQSVTFTASVSVNGSTTPATGEVTFKNVTTGATLGTVTLNNEGLASLKTAALVTGTDLIEAVYDQNPNLGGNSIDIPQTVNQDATTVALAATETSKAPITMTATVTANAPGGGVPTGSVSFYIDGTYVGAGTVNSKGVATFTYEAGVPTGKHTIEAVYSGDTNFLGDSVTETLPFTIGRGT